MCVQRFDDSLNSAIHTTYRISLRSSSMREPRDPLLKVLTNVIDIIQTEGKINAQCLQDTSRRAQRNGWSEPLHRTLNRRQPPTNKAATATHHKRATAANKMKAATNKRKAATN